MICNKRIYFVVESFGGGSSKPNKYNGENAEKDFDYR